MRENWPKVAVIAALVLIVGLPFAMRLFTHSESVQAVEGEQEKLIIITPHNEQIRYEIARAFNAYRATQDLPPVEFDWRTSGGTSDLRKQVLSELEAKARDGLEDDGIGVDLFFGGGDYEHGKLAAGIEVKRDGEKVQVSASVPLNLSADLMAEAFPAPMIGSERLYHPDGYWVGAVLSSFGIAYNRDVLAMLELPEPQNWDALTDPTYVRWIGVADPGHSGSITAAYNAVLRRKGWDEGWQTLREVFANARYFSASSSKVPVDVSNGEAAAGMCIDFYGRYQAGAVGGGRMGYVDPSDVMPGGVRVSVTATTADPISVLRGAPNDALAREFVAWLLTKPAQRLWQRKLGTEDGPEKFELRRQPIRQDLYTDAERAHWADPEISPFDTASPFPSGTPNYFSFVAPVAHAMAIDIHDDLLAAWYALQAVPASSPKHAELVELFEAMPKELEVEWSRPRLSKTWQTAIADSSHPDHAAVKADLRRFYVRLSARYRAGRYLRWPSKELAEEMGPIWAIAARDPEHPRHDVAVVTIAQLMDFVGPTFAVGLDLDWPDADVLRDAEAIVANRNDERRERLNEAVERYVTWQAQAEDIEIRDRLRWTKFFQENYREVASQAGKQAAAR